MKLLRKFKDWWFTKSLLERGILLDVTSPVTTQEDPAVHEAKKRVRKAFTQQAKQIIARRNRPHSMKCNNPDICTKANCFKVVPDTIVEDHVKIVVITKDIRKNIQE